MGDNIHAVFGSVSKEHCYMISAAAALPTVSAADLAREESEIATERSSHAGLTTLRHELPAAPRHEPPRPRKVVETFTRPLGTDGSVPRTLT